MSTSLLYHAFSIRGSQYVRTEYQDGEVTFTIQQEPKTFRCETCGSRDVRPRGRVERRFRSLPIGSRATAYYLKEDLRQFWSQPGKTFAGAFLTDWVRRAEASGVRMLRQMAKTLESHRAGLLAYYDYPISTGPLEGTNNKIKTMKRQAYGFRDQEFFKLKILAIHEARYALVG